MYSGIEKQAKKKAKEFRQEIKESKSGLLKLLAFESIPFVMGASLGGAGRINGAEWIPVVPLVMDLIGGGFNPITYAKYGVGIGVVYADKVYLIANELANNSSLF